jgi:hypothetical protein
MEMTAFAKNTRINIAGLGNCQGWVNSVIFFTCTKGYASSANEK